jgi:hypothetical protein
MRIALVGLALLCAGCAKNASDVQATYTSPILYESWSCQQLAEEAARISSRAAIASGEQDRKASNDKVATTVAVVVFWPAAFFVGGDGTNAAELGRLKGEMEAIEQASIRKRCSITFQRG